MKTCVKSLILDTKSYNIHVVRSCLVGKVTICGKRQNL